MKNVLTVMLLIGATGCSTAPSSTTASTSAKATGSGKVASDICDDGMKDSGFRFVVSHVKDDMKHVVVLEKGKIGTKQTVDFYISFVEKTAKSSTFQAPQIDGGLKMVMSPANSSGEKPASFFLGTKTGVKEIKTICSPQ